MEKVHIDFIKQNVPQFYYKRLNLTDLAVGYFIIPIEQGYAFLLRTMRTKWQTAEGNNVLRVRTKFIQQVRDRTLQNDFYPFGLICTPGTAGFHSDGSGTLVQGVEVYAAPQPADMTAFGFNFSANPVKNNLILNYFYQHQEALDLRIEFQPLSVEQGYVDIVMVGYLIPDLSLGEWGGTND